jgi:hypothetical protein
VTTDQLLLLAGVLFFLIAVVGGGFSIREIKLPRVPAWARAASAVLGLVFTGYYFWQELGRDAGTGPSIIFENDVGEVSAHGLQARAIKVMTRKGEPKVGDPITIEFQLQYVGSAEEPPRLVASYISSEDPDGDNRDFGWSRSDRDLNGGVLVSSKHVVALEKAGVWSLWPCYALRLPENPAEDVYCPRWNVFQVFVEP